MGSVRAGALKKNLPFDDINFIAFNRLAILSRTGVSSQCTDD
jgi:hypothetical protein